MMIMNIHNIYKFLSKIRLSTSLLIIVLTIFCYTYSSAQITITGSNTITTNRGTTQLQANDGRGASSDVTSTATWTSSDTMIATVSAGLVTAVKNGIVTITVAANGRTATTDITITNQAATLSITGTNTISTLAGTTQLAVTDGTIDVISSATWTVDDTSIATVNSSGLVTAVANGTVTVTASLTDKTGTYTITITNQTRSLTIAGERNLTTVNIGDKLVMKANDLSGNIVDARWEVKGVDGVSATALATIDAVDGVLTIPAVDKNGRAGVVTVLAVKATDNAVKGSTYITITSPTTTYKLSISSIPDYGTGIVPAINTPNGKLQLTVRSNPDTAVGYVWTLLRRNPLNNSEKILSTDATFTKSGVFDETIEITAVRNNIIFARVSLKNNSTIIAEQQITITNQNYTPTPATSVVVSPSGISAAINTDKGSIPMTAEVLPATTSDKTVRWSIQNGSTLATITAQGLLTATGTADGQVTVRATVIATPTVFKDTIVQITNTKPVTDIQSISLVNDSTKDIVVGENFSLRVIINPKTTTDKSITWKISDENYLTIANAQNATFRPIRITKNTQVTIQAISGSNSKIMSEPYVIIIEENPNVPSPPLGIPHFNDNNVNIFPNPTSHYINVKTSVDIENPPFTILNNKGKKMLNGTLNNDNQIDISTLPSGTYIINLNNKQLIRKVIKK